MSTYMAMPWSGHLIQLYRMFGYLKAHPRRKLAYDAQHPRISEKMFKQYDWFDFFRYSKEAIPYDMQKPRGNSMSKHCFVDASHGSDRATRRLQTGILIFCNRAPIIWHSKRQNTVDASTFGSKFQATKNAVELIESLRYKLRMFGVPIEGPTNIFVTTKRYTKKTSLPKSTLKKKHHLITYHRQVLRQIFLSPTRRSGLCLQCNRLGEIYCKCNTVVAFCSFGCLSAQSAM